MELEKNEFGFKATVPLITEDEMKIINNDFNNTINKFLNTIIKDKDLATAQYIIKRQQEHMEELIRNSISKKKIEDKIEELNEEFKNYKIDVNCSQDNYYELSDKYAFAEEKLQELLEDK